MNYSSLVTKARLALLVARVEGGDLGGDLSGDLAGGLAGG